jgi:uncharacterized membrane-anchored protein YhcB (DUF1043 family)
MCVREYVRMYVCACVSMIVGACAGMLSARFMHIAMHVQRHRGDRRKIVQMEELANVEHHF